MKTSGSHAFASQLLLCLLVTFGFGGSVGLATVWMRHQNAVLAKSNRALEAKIAEVQRAVAHWTSLVESEKSSDVLRRRSAEMRLGLALATDGQVQRITEDPMQRLAQRNSRELLRDGPGAVTLRLAMNE